MTTVVHQYEDKLLEFAYGDLPAHEASAISAHLQTCQRCNQSLAQINAVRSTMQKLPVLEAPDAGLDSLLAYAEQTAHRNKTVAAPVPWYRRWLVPLASVAALSVVGVVALKASDDFHPDPARAALLEAKQASAPQKAKKSGLRDFGQSNEGAKSEGVAAAAAPEPMPPPPVEAPAVEAALGTEKERQFAYKDEQRVRYDDSLGKRGGRTQQLANDNDDSRASEQYRGQALPQTKPVAKAPAAPAPAAEPIRLADDFSNAAQRGATKYVPREEVVAPPPKATVTGPAQKIEGANLSVGYGLGTASTGSTLAGRPPSPSSVTAGGSVWSPPPPAVDLPTKAKTDAKKSAEAPQAASNKDSMPFKLSGPAPSSMPADNTPDELALESVADKRKVDADTSYQRRANEKAVQDALMQARDAANRGDTRTSVAAALVALNGGAEGYSQVEALKRLCDGYEALGDQRSADRYCDQLIRNFGSTAAAQVVMARRRQVQTATPTGTAASEVDAAPTSAGARKAAPSKASKVMADEPSPSSVPAF